MTRRSSIARPSRAAGRAAALLLVALGAATLAPAALAADRKLAFAVAGVVDKVLVRSGQRVAAGAPLAQLDPAPFEARAAAAEAALAAADLDLKHAEENLTRVRQLYDDLSTSGQALEEAESRLAHAQATQLRAKARSDLAAWRRDRATLRAPRAGTVAAVPAYPGMVVDPRAAITTAVVLSF
ncbi:MAG: biotin/lipoyl-binding protein [Hyphomicrobiales bacterium]|nr:biotin/lipoyl-binding protein [Hyphomicrobiales bacterium]